MIAILIIGLPCSGKSTFARKFNCEIIDDFRDHVDLLNKLEFCAKNKTNLVICDINFCITEIRRKTKEILGNYGYLDILEFFYENDIEKCLNNLTYRKDLGDLREVEGAIRGYSKLYEIPENAIMLKIWQNNN